MDKTDIKSLSRAELEGVFARDGIPSYRARQVFRWLFKEGAEAFNRMTDIPRDLRKALEKDYSITDLRLMETKISRGDGTKKYLLGLSDGHMVETVFIPGRERNTICLSSQVGCKFGCVFCASASKGFARDLTQSEITGQLHAVRGLNPRAHLTNLVFMGIGEPLDNYGNVLRAARIFNDPDAFNIGARKITISTCGIIPGIDRLSKEGIQLELSISLHASTDSLRSELVPANKLYPLKKLIPCCIRYAGSTGRVITFEYILIKDVNSGKEDAEALAKLIRDVPSKVNTIGYNRTVAGGYEGADEKEIRVFHDILKKRGISSTHRRSHGDDIDAACGQLRIARATQ